MTSRARHILLNIVEQSRTDDQRISVSTAMYDVYCKVNDPSLGEKLGHTQDGPEMLISIVVTDSRTNFK